MKVLFAICLVFAVAADQSFLTLQTTPPAIFVSDSSTWVVSSQSPRGAPSTILNSVWSGCIDGATWIWDVRQNELITATFYKVVTVYERPIKATLTYNADDTIQIFVDGVSAVNDVSSGLWNIQGQKNKDLTSFFSTVGVHLIRFDVKNTGGPCGLLYKLVLS